MKVTGAPMLVVETAEDEADFRCGFCKGTFGLELDLPTQAEQRETAVCEAIRQHYDPGVPDDTLVLPRCDNWSRWTSSMWELRDASANVKVIARGEVVVRRNGTIEVTRAQRDR